MRVPGSGPQIQVLLATFNGARFLREQIDSILSQDFANVTILARDDGSTDATRDILAHCAALHPAGMRIIQDSSPTGSAKLNFLALMQAAEAPYVALSDQDDVWLPAKLSRSFAAMQRLERHHPAHTPLLVFTDLRVVDEHLNLLAPSMWKHLHLDPTAAISLPRLLGRSIVTGCTMLINQSLLAVARQMPAEATMHDRWLALVAASLGGTAFLPEQTVLYRQHEHNVIGAALRAGSVALRATNGSGRHAERLRSEQQVEALINLHGPNMPPENLRILERYLRSGRDPNPLARVALTMRYGFTRGSILANLALLLDLLRLG